MTKRNKKPHISVVFYPSPHKIRGAKTRSGSESQKENKKCTGIFEHNISMPSKNITHTVHVYTLKSYKLMGRSNFDGKTMNFKDDSLQYKPGKKNKTSPFSH